MSGFICENTPSAAELQRAISQALSAAEQTLHMSLTTIHTNAEYYGGHSSEAFRQAIVAVNFAYGAQRRVLAQAQRAVEKGKERESSTRTAQLCISEFVGEALRGGRGRLGSAYGPGPVGGIET